MIKKLFTRTSLALSAFLTTTIILYLVLGHPNDKRISFEDIPKKVVNNPTTHFKFRKSILLDDLEVRFPISEELYRNYIKKINQENKQHIFARHKNNTHKFYDTQISLGTFPERLHGLYGFALPKDNTIAIKPALKTNTAIRFKAAAIKHENEIIISLNGSKLTSKVLAKIDSPRRTDTFWYKNFFRYLYPDAPIPGGQWLEISTEQKLSNTDTVEIQCLSEHKEDSSCLISDIEFLYNEKEKTNLNRQTIFILVDTLRNDFMNKHNAPTLEKFSETAVTFNRFIAPGNMTSPSTNSILFGTYPFQQEDISFSYGIDDHERNIQYEKNRPSFPNLLEKNHIKTAMIGNISVISELNKTGYDHGFSEQIAIEVHNYDTPKIAREAIQWIADHKDQDFFLYIHFHATHAPYRPPLADVFNTYPGLAAASTHPDALRWLYQGVVHYTDRYIDKIFSYLKNENLYENFNIILTADHGDHHEWRHFKDNEIGGDFKGTYFDHGATLYEDEINIPFIVKIAQNEKSEKSEKSKKIKKRFSGVDIAPTILDLYQIKVPHWYSGVNLLPLIKGEIDEEDLEDRIISSEGFRRQAVYFKNRFKYIKQFKPVRKRVYSPENLQSRYYDYFSKELLFDLENDPREQVNLIHTKPQLAATLKKVFDKHFEVAHSYRFKVSCDKPCAIRVESEETITPEPGPRCENRKSQGKINYCVNTQATEYTLEYLAKKSDSRQLLSFYIDENKLDLYFSELELRIENDHEPIELMPLEQSQSILVASSNIQKPYVTVQKLSNGKEQDRKISAGNKEMEKILKDWGYLNEDI